MKVQSFDRQTVRHVAHDVEQLLQDYASKVGLHMSPVQARFDSERCKVSLELSVLGKNGQPRTQVVSDFEQLAPGYGLQAADLGAQFEYRSEAYVIAGLKPSAKRYPVLGKRVRDGKVFKFGADMVLRALGRKVPAWLDMPRRSIGYRETPWED